MECTCILADIDHVLYMPDTHKWNCYFLLPNKILNPVTSERNKETTSLKPQQCCSLSTRRPPVSSLSNAAHCQQGDHQSQASAMLLTVNKETTSLKPQQCCSLSTNDPSQSRHVTPTLMLCKRNNNNNNNNNNNIKQQFYFSITVNL